jgi:hypothetical protein
MASVRFPTAQSLFDAFPEITKTIASPPLDVSSIQFVEDLARAGKLDDAVTFCTHLLPRREAVWWACWCVRALLGNTLVSQATGLAAAEAWVREPDDEHRRAALHIGSAGDNDEPTIWLARSAGWAGGMFVAHPKSPVPVPQFMTARASRIAVLLGARLIKPAERAELLRVLVADAIKLAENGL